MTRETPCPAANGGCSWLVTFTGVDGDVRPLTSNTSHLVGAAPAVTVSTVLQGADALGGNWSASFGGNATALLAHDVSAAVLAQTLEALPAVGSVDVTRTALDAVSAQGFAYAVTFSRRVQPANLGDLPLLGVDATFVRGTEVRLVAAEVSPGCCAVEVANNGQNFAPATSAAALYSFDPVPHVTSVAPQSGPSSGGTLVTVYSEGLNAPSAGTDAADAATTTYCIFGTGAIAAQVAAQRVVLSASTGKPIGATCVAPAHVAGSASSGVVVVAIKQNAFHDAGASISTSAATFEYRPAPSVTTVRPKLAPVVGGTALAVHGANFAANALLACRFHSAALAAANVSATWTVSATFVATDVVKCVTPSLALHHSTSSSAWMDGSFNATLLGGLGPGTDWNVAAAMTVEVSNNGVDFSRSNVAFRLMPRVNVTSFAPAMGFFSLSSR